MDWSNHFGPRRRRICYCTVLASSPTYRLCYGNGPCRSCSDIPHGPSLAVWGSGCRPLSTATGDALVRCQSRCSRLVDCRARHDACAAALASRPARALLWYCARIFLSCIPVHHPTTGKQGRLIICELPHGAKLPVILFRGSYAGCKLCRLCWVSSSICFRWIYLHRLGAVPGYATSAGETLLCNHDFSASPSSRDTLSDIRDA